ncbi:hypothetical protein [Fusibacter ferrireducens]|uniref:Type II secretion system protein GspF domain-containing protein n=1 Tax=Fusibacter ferrireducens TaxID=2785058 RepID=A0ABR9ZNF4_9FIRM|nr:hypothetical protein [Fusibacter ferrireducens]MBF4691851.1 hypothetical protein [Fusibacter ferrireducens]
MLKVKMLKVKDKDKDEDEDKDKDKDLKIELKKGEGKKKTSKLKQKKKQKSKSNLEIKLELYNKKVDAFLYMHKLKKLKPHPFAVELPSFIQEIILNMTCDMTIESAVKGAIINNSENPNFEALNLKIEKQISAINALNMFALECNFHDLWKLSRLINQNFLTGSVNTYSAMERFHDELWDQKLQNVKTASERASLYLTFVLMLSLFSVIVVVVTPIMININL